MKRHLLLLAAIGVPALLLNAQQLKNEYVTWPSSSQLHTYISAWNGGNGTITINGQTWEDENFFISRVKPKARVFNTATQIYPGMSQWSTTNKSGNDKRVIWWVPIGDAKRNGVNTNALPNSLFDSETFSMWSYIDHWGNWTSPYGWVPGNFADAAHKNGVAVSGTAQPPNAACPTEWQTCFNGMGNLNSDAIGKFLLYHGVDGLGYNSEWSSYSPSKLITMHNNLMTYMKNEGNPLWEVIWYGGTNDNGTLAFDSGLTNNTKLFAGASIFLNYNWNNASRINSAVSTAEGMSRSPFYIYAGMNQQGGEPKSGENYAMLKDYKHSIGLWGAHNNNMFWETRNANGSSDEAMQRTYLKLCQQWFGNGVLNPAIKSTPTTVRNHRPTDTWAGISSMVSARTAIQNDITTEPFFTYFSLGNGKFMNWRGERMNDIPWYNIGVQDYLPTWRWWLSPTVRATDVTKGSTNLNVDFSWDDAYIGGSCLRISGTTTEEHLQLFKTQIVMNQNYRIRVYYKLLEGSADINIETCNGKGVQPKTVEMLTVAGSEEACDKTYTEGWQTFEYKVVANWRSTYNSTNLGMGILGFGFKNAKNMDLLIGGIEILPGTTTAVTEMAQPSAPTIKTAKVLANNSKGMDAKLIWNMPNSKAAGVPVYNTDVNTAMFRMWFQQEGGEQVMMGLTTSWAGLIYQAPYDATKGGRVRFGVSALPLDMNEKKESAVTWSDWLTAPSYEVVEDIQIDKTIIKPEEEFTLSFVDPAHASATWVLTDASTGSEVWRGTGSSVTCPGLSKTGAYTLKITSGTNTTEYQRYVAISSEAVGALPQIYTVGINDKGTEEKDSEITIKYNESRNFTYTGRKADGSASRGVGLNEEWLGVKVGDLGLQSGKSFSVSSWVKMSSLPDGRSSFLTIEDRITGAWPQNNWGYFWCRLSPQGKFKDSNINAAWALRTTSSGADWLMYDFKEAQIVPDAWTHVAIVFEFNSSGQVRQILYINGQPQKVAYWLDVPSGTLASFYDSNYSGNWDNLDKAYSRCSSIIAKGKDVDDPTTLPYVNAQYNLGTSMWIALGGTAQNISAADGTVDDFTIWGKAMTQEDVNNAMNGLDKNNLPADVLAFWDFENDSQSDNGFIGAVGANATNKSPKCYNWSIVSGSNEGSASKFQYDQAVYQSGCPFISGTAYPIVTKPTWTANRAVVSGNGTGESGSADITFPKTGDYNVKLTLENGHGKDERTYPVVHVVESTTAIDDIAADNDAIATYTVDGTLFVDFAQDGRYFVEVYNTSGMLQASKEINAVAGGNVSIGLGAKGIYLVKVVKDGSALRTVKVINK